MIDKQKAPREFWLAREKDSQDGSLYWEPAIYGTGIKYIRADLHEHEMDKAKEVDIPADIVESPLPPDVVEAMNAIAITDKPITEAYADVVDACRKHMPKEGEKVVWKEGAKIVWEKDRIGCEENVLNGRSQVCKDAEIKSSCSIPIKAATKHILFCHDGKNYTYIRADVAEQEKSELLEALEVAYGHLEYCNYGDSWERECAVDAKLPQMLEAVIAKAKGQ